tara:strand:+ start:42 stop:203 length:162 start_codon:yes stop_codon:yes gene_type:complete
MIIRMNGDVSSLEIRMLAKGYTGYLNEYEPEFKSIAWPEEALNFINKHQLGRF